MNYTKHWDELALLPAEQLKAYAGAIIKLAEVRAAFDTVALPAPAVQTDPAPSEPKPATLPPASALGNDVCRRERMRPPKSGSLRASVHEVLAQARGPMRRAAVAKQVALKRGERGDDRFVNAVGEILRNPHDPYVRKVSTGVYEFVPAGLSIAP